MIRRPNGVTFTFAAVTASRDEKDSRNQISNPIVKRPRSFPAVSLIFAYLFLYLFFQVSRAGESFFSCLSTSL